MNYFILLIAIILNVVAQLSVKSSAIQAGLKTSASGQAGVFARSPYFWLAIGFYGLSFLLYSFVLTKFEVSRAYPISSIAAILMLTLLSAIFFQESLTFYKAAGIVLAAFGIILLFK